MITQDQAKTIVTNMTQDLISQQKAKGAQPTWNQLFHQLMLSKCVVEVYRLSPDKTDEKQMKKDMGVVFEAGCAGNTSQFRQRLEKDKVIDKATDLVTEYV